MLPYSVHCAHIYYFIDIDRQSYDQTLGISNTFVLVNALVICCNIYIPRIYYVGSHMLFTQVHSGADYIWRLNNQLLMLRLT